jgi:hypothetical protein
MNKSAVKRIPYGIADYGRLRELNGYYVDKTHFIPRLEEAPLYLFLIRPRRFGKTLWLSVLQHYYDVNFAEQFDELFSGTYIGENPTPARNAYLVLMLNFATVNPDPHYVKESFEANGKAMVNDFLSRYADFFDARECETILALSRTEDMLREIFLYAKRHGLQIYMLIDEYDNFANTILTTHGQAAYHELTHGAGFFRYFFNLLKGATSGQMSGLSRLFITGVSPITMDDVTSGFNIGANFSLNPNFNEMLGFREDEVHAILEYYHTAGALPLAPADCMDTLKDWYDHYCFSEGMPEHVFNSDMVFYFLQTAMIHQGWPKDMIDQNIRVDYNKLRHLLTVDRRLNGNFSQLQHIIDNGETRGTIVPSFPVERLTAQENFVSLLFYMGLLTFADVREGRAVLRIPNLTIKTLMYGYLRDGFADTDVFRIDMWYFSDLMHAMAYRGEWRAVFEFLAEEIEKQAAVRDYLGGEKMVQGFLLAYLNVTNYFLTWSERELGGGFADLYLEPFLARYPEMPYGYLIELKYIPKSVYSPARQAEQIEQARVQLQHYAGDARVEAVASTVTLKKLILVYKGWELVHCEDV